MWLITNQGLFSHSSFCFISAILHRLPAETIEYQSVDWLWEGKGKTGNFLGCKQRRRIRKSREIRPLRSRSAGNRSQKQIFFLRIFTQFDFRLNFHSNSIGMRGVSSFYSIFRQMSDNPEWFLAVSCLFVNFSIASTNCTLLTMTQTSSLSASEMDSSTCSSAIFTR